MIVNEETKRAMAAVLNSETDNFVALIKAAGMDPAKDFRWSDLSGCDFSNCDLRGFDFTGADLRDSTGTNVTFDETTILTKASVSGSVFEVRT